MKQKLKSTKPYTHHPEIGNPDGKYEIPLSDEPMREFEAFIWVDGKIHEFEHDVYLTAKKWLANAVLQNPVSNHYGLLCNNLTGNGPCFHIFLERPNEEENEE